MPSALVFSSLGYNTGCALRARYLAAALERNGWRVEFVRPPFPSLPASLEILLTLPVYLAKALIRRPGLAVGIKPYPNTWLPLLVLQWMGKKAVLDFDDLDGAYRGGILGLAGSMSQWPAFRLVRFFSTHHPGLRAYLETVKRIDSRNIFRLSQGVDLDVFAPGLALPVEFRGMLKGVAHGRKIVLFAAHLNVACDFPVLLEWVAPVLRKHPGHILAVAGGGPRLDEFRRLGVRTLGQSVYFTGPLNPETMRHWMAAAGVCLAGWGPSEANRFRVPMKVAEYLAMARPVVCNRITGLADLEPYLYCARRGGAGVARALERFLARGGDGREKKGAAFVRRNKNWRNVAASFLKQAGLDGMA